MRQETQRGGVLLVSNYPSGTRYAWWLMEHFWCVIARELAAAGRPTFLAFPSIDTVSACIEEAGIKVVELGLPWESSAQKVDVLRFIRDNDIRGIYLTDQPYSARDYASLRLAGVRRIIIHDHTPGDRPPIGGVKGLIKSIRNEIPWTSADRVYCVSELMRQRNCRNGRIPGRKLRVIQNGIAPLSRSGWERASVRTELGLGDDRILVVTTGRAHPYKRFDFVIDSALAVSRLVPAAKVCFLLVGDGPALPELKDKVDRLGLQDSVRLLGYREDVPSVLFASDLAFHAALGEGFSLSIVEYMSASLPVLVPDIPSVSQAVTDGKTGRLYPPTDSDSAAKVIHELAADDERRIEMGRLAKEDADTKYSLDACTSQFASAVRADFRIG